MQRLPIEEHFTDETTIVVDGKILAIDYGMEGDLYVGMLREERHFLSAPDKTELLARLRSMYIADKRYKASKNL